MSAAVPSIGSAARISKTLLSEHLFCAACAAWPAERRARGGNRPDPRGQGVLATAGSMQEP